MANQARADIREQQPRPGVHNPDSGSRPLQGVWRDHILETTERDEEPELADGS